jgi:hypothetical protein
VIVNPQARSVAWDAEEDARVSRNVRRLIERKRLGDATDKWIAATFDAEEKAEQAELMDAYVFFGRSGYALSKAVDKITNRYHGDGKGIPPVLIAEGLKIDWDRAGNRRDRQKLLRRAMRRKAARERDSSSSDQANYLVRRSLRRAGLPVDPID